MESIHRLGNVSVHGWACTVQTTHSGYDQPSVQNQPLRIPNLTTLLREVQLSCAFKPHVERLVKEASGIPSDIRMESTWLCGFEK